MSGGSIAEQIGRLLLSDMAFSYCRCSDYTRAEADKQKKQHNIKWLATGKVRWLGSGYWHDIFAGCLCNLRLGAGGYGVEAEAPRAGTGRLTVCVSSVGFSADSIFLASTLR